MAEVIQFADRKPFDAIEHFKGQLGNYEHDFCYMSDMEKQTMAHSYSFVISVASNEPKGLRYYFKELLGYDPHDMALVLNHYKTEQIFSVLAFKRLYKDLHGIDLMS